MWRVQEFVWQSTDGSMHKYRDDEPGVQSIMLVWRTGDNPYGDFVVTLVAAAGEPSVQVIVSEELVSTAVLHPAVVEREPTYVTWEDV